MVGSPRLFGSEIHEAGCTDIIQHPASVIGVARKGRHAVGIERQGDRQAGTGRGRHHHVAQLVDGNPVGHRGEGDHLGGLVDGQEVCDRAGVVRIIHRGHHRVASRRGRKVGGSVVSQHHVDPRRGGLDRGHQRVGAPGDRQVGESDRAGHLGHRERPVHQRVKAVVDRGQTAHAHHDRIGAGGAGRSRHGGETGLPGDRAESLAAGKARDGGGEHGIGHTVGAALVVCRHRQDLLGHVEGLVDAGGRLVISVPGLGGGDRGGAGFADRDQAVGGHRCDVGVGREIRNRQTGRGYGPGGEGGVAVRFGRQGIEGDRLAVLGDREDPLIGNADSVRGAGSIFHERRGAEVGLVIVPLAVRRQFDQLVFVEIVIGLTTVPVGVGSGRRGTVGPENLARFRSIHPLPYPFDVLVAPPEPPVRVKFRRQQSQKLFFFRGSNRGEVTSLSQHGLGQGVRPGHAPKHGVGHQPIKMPVEGHRIAQRKRHQPVGDGGVGRGEGHRPQGGLVLGGRAVAGKTQHPVGGVVTGDERSAVVAQAQRVARRKTGGNLHPRGIQRNGGAVLHCQAGIHHHRPCRQGVGVGRGRGREGQRRGDGQNIGGTSLIVRVRHSGHHRVGADVHRRVGRSVVGQSHGGGRRGAGGEGLGAAVPDPVRRSAEDRSQAGLGDAVVEGAGSGIVRVTARGRHRIVTHHRGRRGGRAVTRPVPAGIGVGEPADPRGSGGVPDPGSGVGGAGRRIEVDIGGGERGRAYRESSAQVVKVVVVRNPSRQGDRVGSDRGPRRCGGAGGRGGGQIGRALPRGKAGVGEGQGRIRLPVGLALVGGGHRQGLLVDRQRLANADRLLIGAVACLAGGDRGGAGLADRHPVAGDGGDVGVGGGVGKREAGAGGAAQAEGRIPVRLGCQCPKGDRLPRFGGEGSVGGDAGAVHVGRLDPVVVVRQIDQIREQGADVLGTGAVIGGEGDRGAAVQVGGTGPEIELGRGDEAVGIHRAGDRHPRSAGNRRAECGNRRATQGTSGKADFPHSGIASVRDKKVAGRICPDRHGIVEFGNPERPVGISGGTSREGSHHAIGGDLSDQMLGTGIHAPREVRVRDVKVAVLPHDDIQGAIEAGGCVGSVRRRGFCRKRFQGGRRGWQTCRPEVIGGTSQHNIANFYFPNLGVPRIHHVGQIPGCIQGQAHRKVPSGIIARPYKLPDGIVGKDSCVTRVRHVKESLPIDHQTGRASELTLSDLGHGAIGGKFPNTVLERVGNVKVPGSIHGDPMVIPHISGGGVDIGDHSAGRDFSDDGVSVVHHINVVRGIHRQAVKVAAEAGGGSGSIGVAGGGSGEGGYLP